MFLQWKLRLELEAAQCLSFSLSNELSSGMFNVSFWSSSPSSIMFLTVLDMIVSLETSLEQLGFVKQDSLKKVKGSFM